jgi:hypothetical protein
VLAVALALVLGSTKSARHTFLFLVRELPASVCVGIWNIGCFAELGHAHAVNEVENGCRGRGNNNIAEHREVSTSQPSELP